MIKKLSAMFGNSKSNRATAVAPVALSSAPEGRADVLKQYPPARKGPSDSFPWDTHAYAVAQDHGVAPLCHITTRKTDSTVIVTVAPIVRACRSPIDVCCVVDISGSMHGEAGLTSASGLYLFSYSYILIFMYVCIF